jgi:hypothetical protein
MIIKQLLCLCRLHWYGLPYSPMIWRHDKLVRQKRSGATSHHSFITSVVIQHLVSVKLLSSISKENIHNVR